MTHDQMKRLQVGDIIRHASNNDGYIVTANYGNRVTAVRTIDATNPFEWEVVRGPANIDEKTPNL